MIKKQRIILWLLVIFIFSSINALAVSPKVYDKASLFTNSELQDLDKRAEELTEEYKLDLVIVTTNDTEGKSTQAYADDFFDYNGFGYNGTEDGVLLLIDMQHREVYISTCGMGIRYLTDDRINSILDNVYPYLSDKEYAKGASRFLDDIETYVKMGVPKDQYNQSGSTSNSTGSSGSYSSNDYSSRDYYYDSNDKELTFGEKILISLGISLAVAGITIGIMALNNRGKNTITPTTYLEGNSFRIVGSEDIHYDTKVTHIKINTNSGSSGGSKSSTHSSSSGRSHGGGGRSF